MEEHRAAQRKAAIRNDLKGKDVVPEDEIWVSLDCSSGCLYSSFLIKSPHYRQVRAMAREQSVEEDSRWLCALLEAPCYLRCSFWSQII